MSFNAATVRAGRSWALSLCWRAYPNRLTRISKNRWAVTSAAAAHMSAFARQ